MGGGEEVGAGIGVQNKKKKDIVIPLEHSLTSLVFLFCDIQKLFLDSLILFYRYHCFACIYVYASYAYLVFLKVR